MGKNVASEIAHQICDSVRTSLLGQKLPSLTRYAHHSIPLPIM